MPNTDAADTAPSSPAPAPESVADETMEVNAPESETHPENQETTTEQPQAGPSEKAPRRVYNRKVKVSINATTLH